jgi:hypothetical protein
MPEDMASVLACAGIGAPPAMIDAASSSAAPAAAGLRSPPSQPRKPRQPRKPLGRPLDLRAFRALLAPWALLALLASEPRALQELPEPLAL